MPKNKKPVESTRTRRQASKEALKQLQLLLDDEDDDTFVIPIEEESKKEIRLDPPPPPPPKKRAVSPIIMESPPPKKKYKLSHRKSSDGNDRDVIVLKSISNSNYAPKENTLELDCFVEELSEVQMERQKKVELEEKELQAKLDNLLKNKKAEVVFTGGISSAIEVNELIMDNRDKSFFNPKELPELGEVSEPLTPTFQLVMDPRLGIIVGSVEKNTNPVLTPAPAITKGKLQISSAVKAVATLPPSTSPPPTRNMRTRRSGFPTPPLTIQSRANNTLATRANSLGVVTRGNTPRTSNPVSTRGLPQTATPSPTIQTRGMKGTPTIQTRNNKATPPTGKRPVVSVSGEKPKQVVDLTSEDNRNQADNREISFNKLQGKTYPSLVVVARPQLRVTDLAVDRAKLDSKVKSVLMHPPTKFTEWLIQQGLIRSEQKCPVHSNTQLKLGMYSDAAKFPFSGGYVWISECCPQRFISVFNGSIFEGSPHAPIVMLKLIYHWSCQTNIQNVTQWVKVDNLYVKGVYTWLRGVCTLAVQSQLRQLGGPGSRIEVGVISLGTTSHDGNQRQVKVEVLGVMESNTKYVRLRAVEPMPDGDRNFRKKFSKILEPILQWVHPASTIVTDLTVDKATLIHMGFTNVVQTTSNDYNQSNRTIMEYLRRIVPRMFQNTLSLLSRQIIQQFLDELVWREWFGITSQAAFDNILSHLAEQTKLNSQPTLVIKLNKVAANPFRVWSNGPVKQQVLGNNQTPVVPATQAPTTSAAIAVKTPISAAKQVAEVVKKYGRGKKGNSPQVQVVQERPTKPVSPDVPEQMVPLENYYYGTIDTMDKSPAKITLSMKCPFCKGSFDNNILLQNHLFKHAHNVSNDAYLCRYCLTSVSTANELIHHVNKCHPGGTKFDYGFVCLICEIHYMNPFVLGKHMSKEHIPHELPYQCGSCSYRCSNHKQVIDHFYMKHDGGSTIQCPFCLKSTTVWSGGRNVSQNIHYFIQHLQKHQKKQFAKRCGKCNLWFVQKEVLKEHQQKMHISLRGKMGLIPFPSPRNGVMVPKSKMDKNPCDAEIINFSSLYYNVPSNSICKECNQGIVSSKHFPSFDNCQNPNCQYSTCCAIAMMTHNAKCKGLNSVIPPETLPFEMFCVCGFRDVDGNSMAKHLALCEKKSAYSSETEAKSATVMHSMLDILGLVRKPEESKNEKAVSIEESTEVSEDSSNVLRKAIPPEEIGILSDEEGQVEEVEIIENIASTENETTVEKKENIDEIKKKEDEKEKNGKITELIELDDEDAEIKEASSDSLLIEHSQNVQEGTSNNIDDTRTEQIESEEVHDASDLAAVTVPEIKEEEDNLAKEDDTELEEEVDTNLDDQLGETGRMDESRDDQTEQSEDMKKNTDDQEERSEDMDKNADDQIGPSEDVDKNIDDQTELPEDMDKNNDDQTEKIEEMEKNTDDQTGQVEGIDGKNDDQMEQTENMQDNEQLTNYEDNIIDDSVKGVKTFQYEDMDTEKFENRIEEEIKADHNPKRSEILADEAIEEMQKDNVEEEIDDGIKEINKIRMDIKIERRIDENIVEESDAGHNMEKEFLAVDQETQIESEENTFVDAEAGSTAAEENDSNEEETSSLNIESNTAVMKEDLELEQIENEIDTQGNDNSEKLEDEAVARTEEEVEEIDHVVKADEIIFSQGNDVDEHDHESIPNEHEDTIVSISEDIGIEQENCNEKIGLNEIESDSVECTKNIEVPIQDKDSAKHTEKNEIEPKDFDESTAAAFVNERVGHIRNENEIMIIDKCEITANEEEALLKEPTDDVSPENLHSTEVSEKMELD